MKPRALLIAALLVVSMATAQAVEKPNVILILTDDQGWFDLGVHGNPHIRTPNLDRLAADSVRFSRFYASPVCTPTRAGIMTGRHPQRSGAIDTFMGRDTMDASEVTMAQVFQGAGYRTGLVGKWHLGRYAKYHPNNRGFNEFFGFWQYGFITRYFDPDELFHNREPVSAAGYITDVLTDSALSFISSSKQPFFLTLAYNAPHDPHDAPDRYIEPYLKQGLPLREARIYGMITCIDDNVGRLLQSLKQRNLEENTVVIFMTDNGGVSRYFKAGLRANKGTVYEGGIRVPFFIRWPGKLTAGSEINQPAHYLDVLPTLCDLIGIRPPDRKIDGMSLAPVLRNPHEKLPRRYLFHQWTRVRPKADENWAVQDGRYKLVNGELFDLQVDPGEGINLAAEHPERVRQLRGEFKKWFADVTAGRDYTRVPIEVGREDENPVEIDIAWSEPVGKAIKVTPRRYIRDVIEEWSEPADCVRWKIDVVTPGEYEVILAYGCDPADSGSRLEVRCGSSRLVAEVHATQNRDAFERRSAGQMKLPRGPSVLEIKPLTIKGTELMRLHKVWLRRIDQRSQAR